MNEVELQAWRAKRLREAIEYATDGNASAFARRMGYRDAAFIRQMLAGSRAVSEKTIRLVEEMPGMAGWFSSSSKVAIEAREVQPIYRANVADRYARATTGTKALIDLALRQKGEPLPVWASPAMLEVLKGAVALATSLTESDKSPRAESA